MYIKSKEFADRLKVNGRTLMKSRGIKRIRIAGRTWYDASQLPAEYLTASQVAEGFGVSPNTILRWAKNKEIPCVIFGVKTVRFIEKDIISALAEKGKK